MRNFILSALAYSVIALAFFDSFLKPPALLIFWSDRLAAPWHLFVIASGLSAALAVYLLRNARWVANWKPPIFLALWMLLSIGLTAIYSDHIRQRELTAFKADVMFQNSFLSSLREAPEDWQFYLHAGALRNCVPYAWSYRMMAMYRLPPNAAVNVLPYAWIERCRIVRE